MGMAASQARYLGLTARKTNVEYEGQQINQARTALSNQSANLFNQMLTLSVPTPPSTTDYTTLQYAFSDGANDYAITSMQQTDYTDPSTGEQYNYQVKYVYYQDVLKGIQEKNTNPQVQRIANNTYAHNTADDDTITGAAATVDGTGYNVTGLVDGVSETHAYTQCTAEDQGLITAYARTCGGTFDVSDYENIFRYEDANGNYIFANRSAIEALDGTTDLSESAMAVTVGAPSYKIGNTSANLYDATNLEQKAAYDQLVNDFSEIAGTPVDELWVYSKNGKLCFATQNDLEYSINNHTSSGTTISPLDNQASLYQYYSSTISQEVVQQDYALLDDASGTGRYSTIKLQNSSATFALNSETITDENEYNDAMNQYNYDVAMYDKTIEDINSKTKIIQQEDRTLELRLKQLDTEQKALSTEMDAVKSVIQKNVESTFKTFS